MRWRWANPGVAVIPVKGGLVGLAWMYRYPIQAVSLEIPRGAINPGESAETAARRELREETGLRAEKCKQIGYLYSDSGLIESAVTIVEAQVADSQEGRAQSEPMESIASDLVWKSTADAKVALRNGEIKCAITAAALALHIMSNP